MKKYAFIFYFTFIILSLLIGCSGNSSQDRHGKNKIEDKSGKKIMLLEKKLSALTLKVGQMEKSTARTIVGYFIIILIINLVISIFIAHSYKKHMLASSKKTDKKNKAKTPIKKPAGKTAIVEKTAEKKVVKKVIKKPEKDKKEKGEIES